MQIDDKILQGGERTAFALRSLYSSYGYTYYRMSKFEEYDFYAMNKDFLVSDNVLTFTDTNGKLMALKPDVTLSIIKSSRDEAGVQKVFYSENVYRPSANDSFKEIMQTGLECFGDIGIEEVAEVITLAVKSLRVMGEDCVLDISNLAVADALFEACGVSPDDKRALYEAMSEKNREKAEAIFARQGVMQEVADAAMNLLWISDTLPAAIRAIRSCPLSDCEATRDFLAVLTLLAASDEADKMRVDFSVVGDVNYYNGIVFKGFLKNIPAPVVSGGRYDRLMRKFKRDAGAIGFAVYTDLAEEKPREAAVPTDDWLNVALPKGRLGEKVYAMFDKAGFPCPSLLEESRKLVFENAEKKVRYFWVKPSDVAIYVERGIADVGVAGKDILLEYEPDVYELLDLKKGVCRMAVACPKGFTDDTTRTLRVATKFSNVTRAFYRSRGRDIDVIHLNGSIEIAPILGLSDVIVDIVETGTTLRENDLEVAETIFPISARLIANKSSMKFKKQTIDALSGSLGAVVEESK